MFRHNTVVIRSHGWRWMSCKYRAARSDHQNAPGFVQMLLCLSELSTIFQNQLANIAAKFAVVVSDEVVRQLMADSQIPELCTRRNILNHDVLGRIEPQLILAVEGDDAIMAVMVDMEGRRGAVLRIHLKDHVQALQDGEEAVQLVLRDAELVAGSRMLSTLGRKVQQAASRHATRAQLDAGRLELICAAGLAEGDSHAVLCVAQYSAALHEQGPVRRPCQ